MKSTLLKLKNFFCICIVCVLLLNILSLTNIVIPSITTQKALAQETPFFGNISNTDSLNVDNIAEYEPGIGDPNLPFTSKYPQVKEQVVSEVVPEIPKPGEEVTITTELYGDIDLNTTLIVWSVNGKESLRGIGKKEFKFNMSDTGTLMIIDFEAIPLNAPAIRESWSFAPVDVDILWQANTYTPPFYKGKALFTPEANVTFIALPNIIIDGKRVDPSEVVYKWKVDRVVDGANSGFGKASYDYTGSIILRPTLVQAEVYAATNNAFKGIGGFEISHVFPQALIYEDNPIYGILFNKALRNQYTVKGNEVELSLAPYFFSTNGKNDAVKYTWNMNNNLLAIPKYQNSAIFRRKDDKKGTATISVSVSNPTQILQKAVSGLSLIFNEKINVFGQ